MGRKHSQTVISTAVLLLIGLAGPANAGLVDRNEAALGASADGYNLTKDEATNFYWLDLDVLFDDSIVTTVDVTLATPAYDGFVVATKDQVEEFFDALGLTPYMGDWPITTTAITGAAQDAADEAFGHIGGRGTTASENYESAGIVSDGPSDDNHFMPFMQRVDTLVVISATEVNPSSFSADNVGTWVYRAGAAAVVPEPSTFTMLAFCGLAMAGYSRLRRRRK